jgi:23S rRNA pseudouridine955/2504/2580 synthase
MSEPSPPASPVRHVEIGERHAGQRLDNFLLTTLKGVPRSHVYRLLRRGEVRVNKGRARAEYRLELGDVVRLPPVRMAVPAARLASGEGFQWLAGHVLYEDDELLALDKPAGLAVHGGSGVTVGLIEALRGLRPQAPMLELVHRLDRDTSGCLLIAKSRSMLTAMHRLIRAGEVHKTYLALVAGRWRGGQREVTAALETGRAGKGERHVRVDEEGKASASRFFPKRLFSKATLMEIELLTGRTHQARVHAAHLEHPIAGDDKYGDWEFNRAMRRMGLKRLFLHAARLDFRHPATGVKLRLESPLPADLTTVLERLDHEKAL